MWSRWSITSTRSPPADASRSARMLPANPAPTTSTSASSREERFVLSARRACTDMSHSPRAQQVRNRSQQDLYITPEGPVRDIQVIDLDHSTQWYSGGAEDLPVTGHARCQMQAPAVPALDLGVLVDDQWPRADKAHLSTQDVEQLRELVQRRAA